MLTLPPSVKIYAAAEPVDGRKGFDGLSSMVQATFGVDPLSGHLFVFSTSDAHRCAFCSSIAQDIAS